MQALLNTTMMLFLLTVLIESMLSNRYSLVTVGDDFWCDYQPAEINQVIAEHHSIALSSSLIWPPLLITDSVNISGGHNNCLSADLGLKANKQSRISGYGLQPAIIIKTSTDHMAKINFENLIIESGHADVGGGITADGYFSLALNQVLVTNNHASKSGGGMQITGQNNRIHLQQTQFTHNQAQHGGALSIMGSGHFITLDHSSVYGNDAGISGGGIACEGVNLIKTVDSVVSDNLAEWGNDWSIDLACEVQIGKSRVPITTKY